MNRFRALVLAAVALALIVRCIGIDDLALTHWDEGPYVGFALDRGPGLRGDAWVIYAPPLYPALNWIAFALFGPDPRLAIVIAALAGAVGVWLVALLARAWFGTTAGVIAAFLLALEPLHVAHSRLALTETTFCACLLAALLAATRALDTAGGRGRIRTPAATGAMAGLAACAKFHGLLPLAAYGLVELSRRRWSRVVLAGLAFAPFALALLWIVAETCGIARFRESRAVWVNGLHLWSIRGTLEYGFEIARRFSAILLAPVAIGGIASSIAATIALRGTTRAARQEDADADSGSDDPRQAVVGIVTLALLSVVLCSYRNYVRLFVPAFVLLTPFAAYAIALVARRTSRPALAALVLTLAVVASGVPALRETLVSRGHGYRDMAARVTTELAARSDDDGDVIAVAQQCLFPYLDAATTARVFSITEPEAIAGLARLESGRAGWLLVDQDPGRHARMKPFVAALAPRLEEVARVPNPLAAITMFDRLGPATYARFAQEPEAAEFVAERNLVFLRVRSIER